LNLISEKLNKPYYLDLNLRKQVSTALLVGGFIFLFLFVFRPFELSTLSHNILEISLGYGLVTSSTMLFLSFLLIKVIKKFSDEEHWTVGKAIFWNMLHLFLIGIFNALYSNWIGVTELSISRLLWFQMATILIGIFPVLGMILISEAAMSRKYLKQAKLINNEILEKAQHSSSIKSQKNINEKIISLSSQNENESLEISVDDLLFIKSADNYVEVYFTENQTIQKRLLRNTLKSIDEELKEHGNFFRCHKSYLINLDKIIKVNGNAQGYRFKLKLGDIEIPVSRQYNERIHELL
jgi:hypothetical protein